GGYALAAVDIWWRWRSRCPPNQLLADPPKTSCWWTWWTSFGSLRLKRDELVRGPSAWRRFASSDRVKYSFEHTSLLRSKPACVTLAYVTTSSGEVLELVRIGDDVERREPIALDLERDRLDAFGGANDETGHAVDPRPLDLIGSRDRALAGG